MYNYFLYEQIVWMFLPGLPGSVVGCSVSVSTVVRLFGCQLSGSEQTELHTFRAKRAADIYGVLGFGHIGTCHLEPQDRKICDLDSSFLH